MKYDEAKRLAASLAGMFPNQVTTAQAAYAIKTFQAMIKADVEAAVAEHRRTHKSIDWVALFAACETAWAPRAARPEGSLADVYRRQNRAWAGLCDVEVVLRKYRSDVHASGGSEGYRKKFLHDCQCALVQSGGINPADAEAWANTIFEEPEHFRRVIDDLRANQTPGEAVSSARF